MERNWDDEDLDKQALGSLLQNDQPQRDALAALAETPAAEPKVAPTDQRGGVSNTMPVTTTPAVTPAAPFARENRDALKYTNVGKLEGFNTGDYGGDTKARNSVKNTFGRIASRYANAPNSIEAMMADPDFKAAFPNARRVEGGAGDKIDFGGVLSDFESGVPVGVVDVLTASDPRSNTANGWAWMPDGGGGMAPTGASGPTTTASPRPQNNTGPIDVPSTQDPAVAPTQGAAADPLAAIIREIEALQSGGASPMDQAELMRMLGV